MPKRTDIKRILVIGSGPIVIGQACEFDYSGAQACKVLKEDGFEVILVNSNPATIMTDPGLADRTYVEPITAEFIERVIKKERPDALLPTLGGQTGLNAAVELAKDGTLVKYGGVMLGCDLAIAHKGRPRHNAAEVMGIIGDIKGKTCIINDDMIDTAGTLCANVKELKAMGAGDIYVCATHGIFSGPAIERLNDAPIVECLVTDAIPVEVGGKIKTISVAEEFAQAISAVYHEEPVSTLVGGDFAL